MRRSGRKTRVVFARYNIIEGEDTREVVRRIKASGLG